MGASLLNLVLRQAESLGAGFSSESDGVLLRRFLGTRDDAAFAELLRRHGPMIWGVCRHSLMCHAEAEDAFQATFLALIRSGASVRRGEAVAGWLHGVALRICLKIKRSAARRRHHERNGSRRETDRTVPDAAWTTLLAAVHEEVQGLPETMRAAFVLCELEGVSQPDAAKQLGVKPGTLTSRLTRARQRLV
ncbi:MAG TPA: sigma-70 family RNA polymerase sigma factor, partial [Gemmataceae bacterium]